MTTKKLQQELDEYRERPPLDVAHFIDALAGPLYSWRMARGVVNQPERYGDGKPNGARMSAAGRMANAETRIEELVVQYAVVVMRQRREKALES